MSSSEPKPRDFWSSDELAPDALPEEIGVDELKDRHTSMLRLVARREHNILSLLELSQELSLSMDLYETADLVLLNLMGHLGTAKSALWLIPEGDSSRQIMVLLRAHGFRKQLAEAVGVTCGEQLVKRITDGTTPIEISTLDEMPNPAAAKFAREAKLELFAPVLARGRLIGLIAIGRPLGRESFGEIDLQVMQTSLGMLGVALENNGLYNRMWEQNRQLKAANESMQELDELKSEFLRNVNHELRTPLTVIHAYSELVNDEIEDDSPFLEYARTVLQESVKLKSLIETLLDFAAISEERLAPRVESASIHGFLTDYYRERLPGVTDGLREFGFDYQAAVKEIPFDARCVRQILDTLVDNAIKFTPHGTTITLRASEESPAARQLAIEVQDDGPGVAEDRVIGLFDAFRQGDGSMTRSSGGMGIGLSLARKLAIRMGGTLEMVETSDRGSLFRLLLPIR